MAIIVLALASVGPIVYKALTDPGIKTGGLHTGDASAATTDVNGTWTIIPNAGDNTTSVGYTFHELLPGESRSTSGTTHNVTGEVTVDGGTLTAGNVTVDVNGLQTDVEKRSAYHPAHGRLPNSNIYREHASRYHRRSRQW